MHVNAKELLGIIVECLLGNDSEAEE